MDHVPHGEIIYNSLMVKQLWTVPNYPKNGYYAFQMSDKYCIIEVTFYWSDITME